jgi:hypothetical protein
LAERILGGDILASSIRQITAQAKIIHINPVMVTERLAMPGIEYSVLSAFDWNPFPL